jgi:iron complex outermembrane recepter protein
MKRIIQTVIFSMLVFQAAYAQKAVTGIVKDAQGEPIVGATIQEKGSKNFAITDANGRFSLIPQQELPVTLRISAVGSKVQEIEIYEVGDAVLDIGLKSDNLLDPVVVTARRRSETAQEVPIAISTVSGSVVEESGAFNVNRIKELVPTVQLYSSNPRNTTLNIRGLGSTYGLTNDGIDPGVGFYVDGVYYARPAVTQLDFIDVEQIEVLRGPQGTLFGKNTTAGAFNITTRKPSFSPESNVELSYGNFGFIQAKTSFSGPLVKNKLAARFAFSGTQRDGLIYNEARDEYVNDLNNLGLRGQLLYTPSKKVDILIAADATRQNPNGFAQVYAGVVTTQRAEFRQFNNIIADLGYTLPSENPFDRVVDHDTPWRSLNELGGVSINADVKIGKGTLTSTSAWRYWNWGPSNDRDFTGLPVLNLSQAPSRHDQWSQEVRYAGNLSNKASGVFGVFFLSQKLTSDPYHTEEAGPAQWRFVQNNQDPNWETPGLLDGFGIRTTNNLESVSSAVFANIDWAITDKFHVLPGIRFNYDTKEVDYSRETYGGLDTTDPALLALKARVYTDQEFATSVDNSNFSGQLTANYLFSSKVNAFATYSTSYKPIGVNLGGLPTNQGVTLIELAEVKPEFVTHYEIGVKTNPTDNSTLNLVVHNTNIEDYQTLVQTPELGVNRGYLSNAEEVRVFGLELDGNIRPTSNFSLFASVAYTKGEYVTFTNAPVPLEEVGGPEAFKDVSGGRLPGISEWAGSFGTELTSNDLKLWSNEGKLFVAFDTFFRSEFSSSPSPSQYLNIDGYSLSNARLGFRAENGFSFTLWARNVFNNDYFEQLLAASGSAGHYAAVLGDQRTYGVTLRHSFGR